MSSKSIIEAIHADMAEVGVPITEFDAEFVIRMIRAMQVSYFKYGRVADAYPVRFNADSDVRTHMGKYRHTGNKHYLVDAANFAMIESTHPNPRFNSEWASNDAADSPGRTKQDGKTLVQETNDGTRIMGETVLHHPSD